MTSKTDADDLLRWMTDHGRFAVDRWLRAEALEHDVFALLSELGVLTARGPRRGARGRPGQRRRLRRGRCRSPPSRSAGCTAQPDLGLDRAPGVRRPADGQRSQRSPDSDRRVGAYSSGNAEPPKNQFSIA